MVKQQILSFLLIPWFLLGWLGITWEYASRVDMFIGYSLLLLAIVCWVIWRKNSLELNENIQARIFRFNMLALLYYCFVILIYSPLFVENFNKLAVNMNNPKLCWQSKIGCVNTIARKKLDANLCYKGGIDTAECLAYIASSKGELLVCQMEGVSIADKNKCVEIYAFRKGDIEACEEMSLPKDEIIKLESMKQACVSKVKAKISD